MRSDCEIAAPPKGRRGGHRIQPHVLVWYSSGPLPCHSRQYRHVQVQNEGVHPTRTLHGSTKGLRKAELLAAISLAIDLGLGQPMEHMLRSSLIATRIAERMSLDAQQRATV